MVPADSQGTDLIVEVVESRDEEHGVFVLSVVQNSYFGRICETRFPSNTRKTHLEMKIDTI